VHSSIGCEQQLNLQFTPICWKTTHNQVSDLGVFLESSQLCPSILHVRFRMQGLHIVDERLFIRRF